MKNTQELSEINIDDIPVDELLNLDNQLCFALYVCSKEIIKKYKPLLAPLGLTYTGYITLMALWKTDNISVTELGKKLYLDSGTLTPLLKKLESAGFVMRKRSLTDERNVYISLTPQGIALKEKAATVPRDMACSVFSSNKISTSQVAMIDKLHELMGTLCDS